MSVACAVILSGINGVCLVDCLEECARGDGRSGDGVDVATVLVHRERFCGSLADDASLAVGLEPLVGLGSQSGCLGGLQYCISKHLALGVKAHEYLQVAAESHGC